MDNLIEKYSDIDDMLDMSEIIDDIDPDLNPESSVQSSVLAGQTTKAGIQTQDLQTVINGWAEALNKSAIAKSTGLPVRTPVAQYKGFAAEEFFKQTTKINALAKGIPIIPFLLLLVLVALGLADKLPGKSFLIA